MLWEQILTVPEHTLVVAEQIYTGLLFFWPHLPVQVNHMMIIWWSYEVLYKQKNVNMLDAHIGRRVICVSYWQQVWQKHYAVWMHLIGIYNLNNLCYVLSYNRLITSTLLTGWLMPLVIRIFHWSVNIE